MTFDEFMAKMLETFPKATVYEDFDGQLVIYSGLRQVADDQVVEFDDE